MKKFILCVFALCSLVSPLFAGEIKNVSRSINIATSFDRLIINGDFEVILVNDPTSVVTIGGELGDVNNIVISNKDNFLVVSSTKPVSQGKVVVRIPVQQLVTINLHGDIKLHGEQILNAAVLNIFIDGECSVNFKATGRVQVSHSDECELQVYRNQVKTAGDKQRAR